MCIYVPVYVCVYGYVIYNTVTITSAITGSNQHWRLYVTAMCENEYEICGNAASAMPIEMHEVHSMHAAVERPFTNTG